MYFINDDEVSNFVVVKAKTLALHFKTLFLLNHFNKLCHILKKYSLRH